MIKHKTWHDDSYTQIKTIFDDQNVCLNMYVYM